MIGGQPAVMATHTADESVRYTLLLDEITI